MAKKKGVRIIIVGVQHRTVDVEAMTQIVIALGRELADRARVKKERPTASTRSEP